MWAGWLLGGLCVVFDVFEDVGVGFLLPGWEFVPVSGVGGFRVGEVFEDLAGPAERDELAFLGAAEFGGVAFCEGDEGVDLVIDCGCAFLFPLGCVVPGGDVAGFGVAGVVFFYAGDPDFAEDASSFRLHVVLLVLGGEGVEVRDELACVVVVGEWGEMVLEMSEFTFEETGVCLLGGVDRGVCVCDCLVEVAFLDAGDGEVGKDASAAA